MKHSNNIKRVLLTGYMGSGKTFIGKALARQLSWSYEDLDGLISDQEGLTVAKLFDDKGEAYFRQQEYTLLKELCTKEGLQVISLGGGAYVQDNVHEYLNNDPSSVVVYLKFPPEVLADRLESEKEKRPLLKEADDLTQFIETHLKERSPYYEKADLIVYNEQNPIVVMNQIISYLLYRNQKPSTI